MIPGSYRSTSKVRIICCFGFWSFTDHYSKATYTILWYLPHSEWPQNQAKIKITKSYKQVSGRWKMANYGRNSGISCDIFFEILLPVQIALRHKFSAPGDILQCPMAFHDLRAWTWRDTIALGLIALISEETPSCTVDPRVHFSWCQFIAWALCLGGSYPAIFFQRFCFCFFHRTNQEWPSWHG